ncbi:MAG: hypothetical protein R2761_01315 [Acidimicrobiales bacterium]
MTWQALVDEVERARPVALSVDVFDTCLVRDLVGDEAIELVIDSETALACGQNRAQVADDVERRLCRPVPGVVEALQQIRANGTTITFVSDTERSSRGLELVLRASGLLHDGDQLVVSCEAGTTKADGGLFHAGWRVDGGWHVGNCRWADLTMATRAGIRAYLVDRAEPTRYELAMAARPGTAGPAVAGAARLARLTIVDHCPEQGDALSARLRVLGADVAGQAFGSFLLWLAEERRTVDVNHLLFLSRDGELLSQMASVMPGDHWAGVRLGYLHCSRWSWLLAGAASYGIDEWLAVGTRDESGFVHARRHVVPLASLLGRIGLEVTDLRDHEELAQLPPDEPLPLGSASAWEKLLADSEIRATIKRRAETRHDLLVMHVAELGLTSGRVGLVDVGWRGRLAWAMSPILEEVSGSPPIHFHFGSDQALADAQAVTDIRRFTFEPGIRHAVKNPVACVETLTASGRARVVGYDHSRDGTVRPVFDRHIHQVDNEDRRHLWAGALAMAALLPSRAQLDELGVDTSSLAAEATEVLRLWWNLPDTDEVEAMRGLSFEADEDGRSVRPVITPYTLSELTSNVRQPRIWQQGSATASAPGIGIATRLGRRMRSIWTSSHLWSIPSALAGAEGLL